MTQCKVAVMRNGVSIILKDLTLSLALTPPIRCVPVTVAVFAAVLVDVNGPRAVIDFLIERYHSLGCMSSLCLRGGRANRHRRRVED